MKFILQLFCMYILISSNTFAQKLLDPPKGQPPQCDQAYGGSVQPKTANNVFNSMSGVCHYAGGMRILHKELTSGSSSETKGVLFTCIGDNSSFVIFSCLFSMSFGDL